MSNNKRKRTNKYRRKVRFYNTLNAALFFALIGTGVGFTIKSGVISDLTDSYKQSKIEKEIDSGSSSTYSTIDNSSTCESSASAPSESSITSSSDTASSSASTEESASTEASTTVEDNTLNTTISSDLLDSGYEFKNIDVDKLESINPEYSDSCAWITIDGTNVDYPVVHPDVQTFVEEQDKDKTYMDALVSADSYFLHKGMDNDYSVNGTIFSDAVDVALDSEDINDVTAIYGHHMKSGKMFRDVDYYRSQSYADAHPFGVIYTDDGYAYKVSFFAANVISGSDSSSIQVSDFTSEDEFNEYYNNIEKNSLIKMNDVDLEFGDKVVVLVTCDYSEDNARLALYGKLEKQCVNEKQKEELNNNTSVQRTRK